MDPFNHTLAANEAARDFATIAIAVAGRNVRSMTFEEFMDCLIDAEAPAYQDELLESLPS